jgi:DNA modification methylase
MFSVHAGNDPGNRLEFMDALYCENRDQLNQLSGVLDDGVKIFRQLWGYDSKSFIANCYIWNKELEPFLKSNGVEYIQGVVYQNAPLLREGMGNSRFFHYQGQRNSVGQRYFVRNAFFDLL